MAGKQFTVSIVLNAIDRASGPLGKASAGIKQHAAAFQAIGAAATGAGLAITAAFGKATSDYMRFGKAIAEVSTLVDTSVVNMKELEGGVRKLAVETGESAEILTAALYQTISAGVDAGDAIQFLGVASHMAVGGVTDTATAVDGLTTIINAWGKTSADATEISDSMFVAMKMGKLTIGELSGGYKYIAGTAAKAGMSIDETNAAIAAITTQGFPAQQAARSLNMALLGIIKPGVGAAKMAAELGIELNAAALESKGLSGILADMERATGGSVEKMAKLAGSSQSLRAMLALSGKGGEKYNEILAEMANKTGASAEAYEKMASGAGRAWARMKASLAELGLSVGEALVPVVMKLTEVLKPVIDAFAWFAKTPLGPPIILFTAAIGGLLLALGPLLMALPGLAVLLTTIQGAGGLAGAYAAVVRLAGALPGLSGGLGGAASSLAAMVGPLGAVVALIVAAVIAYKGVQKMKGFGAGAKGAVSNIEAYAAATGRGAELGALRPTAGQQAKGAYMIGGVTAKDMAMIDWMKTEKQRIQREGDVAGKAAWNKIVDSSKSSADSLGAVADASAEAADELSGHSLTTSTRAASDQLDAFSLVMARTTDSVRVMSPDAKGAGNALAKVAEAGQDAADKQEYNSVLAARGSDTLADLAKSAAEATIKLTGLGEAADGPMTVYGLSRGRGAAGGAGSSVNVNINGSVYGMDDFYGLVWEALIAASRDAGYAGA